MKLAIMTAVFTLVVTLLPISAQATENAQPTQEALENLKPYPQQLEGMDRHVIFLSQQENEDLFKVELIAGKTMEADCNRHRLIGQFTEKEVKGWGFSYYTFETEGHIASTLMACPGPKSEQFIEADSIMTRYNSRLPLVTFIPQGYELKYRIWTAGAEQRAERR